MARKRRRTKVNPMLWYGLYAAIAYYGYNWYMQRPPMQMAPAKPMIQGG